MEKSRDLNVIFADFETTNGKKGRVDIYLWCFMTSWNDEYFYGTTLESFFSTLFSFKKNLTIFFHNGAKFDFHYFKEILSSEFVQKFKKDKKTLFRSPPYKFEKPAKNNLLGAGEFSMLTDENKKIISLKIGSPFEFRTKYKKKRIIKNYLLDFKDSCLIFPSSLNNLGKLVGFEKDDFNDYLNIKTGFKDFNTFQNSVKNWESHLKYIKKNCLILKTFLTNMNKVFSWRKWKNTIAGTAYSYLLSDFPNVWIEISKKYTLLDFNIRVNKLGWRYYWVNDGEKNKCYTQKNFIRKVQKLVFPTNWMNKKLKSGFEFFNVSKFYRGGLTTYNPRFQGVEIFQKCEYFDINSSYPNEMLKCNIPYGNPVKNGKFDLLTITAKNDMENKNGIPFLVEQISYLDTSDTRLSYPKKIKKGSTFSVTSVEFERVKNFYGNDWEINKEYSFLTMPAKILFGKYVEKFWLLKSKFSAEKNLVGRFWAKIMLNSLYGKFGEKIERISWLLHNKEWFKVETINETSKYLPIAAAITANARMRIVDSVGKNFNEFLYADTDSLITFKNSKLSRSLKIGNEIGDWKREWNNINWLFIRTRKQYAFSAEKTEKIVFAGLRQIQPFFNVPHMFQTINSVNKNDFMFGKMIVKQILPVHLKSGVLLTEIEKEIKPIYSPEYAYSPESWFYLPRKKRPHAEFRELLRKNYFSKLKNYSQELTKK